MKTLNKDLHGAPSGPSCSRRGFTVSLLSAFGLAAAGAAGEAVRTKPVSVCEAAYYEVLPEQGTK